MSAPRIVDYREWDRFFDATVPQFVKERTFAGKPWALAPFTEKDFQFFVPSVRELSQQFTVGRGKKLPNYFTEERYRTAYLLYWLPFQAMKFRKVFERHQAHLMELLIQKSTLKVLDLGAGPGTASLALKLFIESLPMKRKIKLEFTWVDKDKKILEMGSNLAKHIGINPRTIPSDWTRYNPAEKFDLVLIGGLLNEAYGSIHVDLAPEWIFLEPAIQEVSQNLITQRKKLIEKNEFHVVGPCLHEKQCPMATGKNWCHFSFHQPSSGKWFNAFSNELGSTRHWVKFSYLWVSHKKQIVKPELRLVVSDPLNEKTGGKSVLLCEPMRPNRYRLKAEQKLFRGDIIAVDERKIRKPITK